jgi:hypothetical protein
MLRAQRKGHSPMDAQRAGPHDNAKRAGPHDIGGVPPFQPIDRDEHAAAHWEKEADAIRMLLGDAKRRILRTDETRLAQETLDDATYWRLRYYERWITALERILTGKGVLSAAELDAAREKLRGAGAHLIPADHDDDDHDHDHQPDDEGEATEVSPERLTGMAIRDLLLAKGVLAAREIRAQIEFMDSRGIHLAAPAIVRAWTDEAYRARLLHDANAALIETGTDPGATRVMVVANEPGLHNVIVCTLCSCYPRSVLGRPPSWYKSRAYRARMIAEPRAVLAEFGCVLPEAVRVRVHDSTAELRYLVLPLRPPGVAEGALEAAVTRDMLIGVAR